MAGFDVRGELLIGGEWVDATGKLLKRQALRHERGRQDQASSVDPSTLQPLLNNTDGRFSPDNPMGPYYGQFGRNTPFRLSVQVGRPALELPGVDGSNASTPDAAALDITGDLDVRWEGEADWYAPEPRFLMGRWREPADLAWHMRLEDGRLRFSVFYNGGENAFTLHTLPVLPRRAAFRHTFDVDDGAGGASIRAYWAPSLDGPWTQIGDPLTWTPSAPIVLDTGAAPLEISPPTQTPPEPDRLPLAGRVYRAEVRDGINGTIVAAPDFTAQADGTTSFADSAGRTWTVNGTAAITNRRTRLMHELAAYPVRWHPSGAHAWVEASTAGVLRRLQRGSQALQSTLRRRIPSAGPLAYWPMEDGAAAEQAGSALDGGSPLVVSGMDFASEGSLPSSEPLPVLGDAASMNGGVPGAAAGGWHVEMVYKLEQLPATEQTMLRVLLTSGAGGVAEVRVRVSATAIKLETLDADGGIVSWFQNDASGPGAFIGSWNRLQVFSSVSGGQARASVAWRDVITGLWWVVHTPWTGTPGRVTSVRGSWGVDFRGMALGHLAVWDVGGTGPTTPGITIYEGSDDGFNGETAGARIQRLALEENYPITVYGPIADQQRVGPQTPSAMLELLAEAAEADGGILYEERERLRLRYRSRQTLYRQTPALVLDYTEPVLGPPLEPTGDDDATENDVTVSRTNGSSARAVLEQGALSVQAPPDGVGPYPASTTLNLYSDDQAAPIAYWRMHLGTYEGRRYPQVRVMVHRAPPELLEQILAVDVGDRIIIRNPPRWVAPGDIDLIVQGYEEVWASPYEWDIVFNCTPGEPWMVAAVGDPVYGRIDTSGSTLTAAVDVDDTTLTVTGPAWVTADVPLNQNPDFAQDLTGWAAFGATIERVEAPAPAPTAGRWALKLVPDGVAEFPNAGSEQIPVAVGAQYVVSGWLRCSRARDVALNVNWFGPDSTYLSTSATDHPVEQGAWTWFQATVTAPAGAVTANLAPTVADFPPTTDVLWVQQATLRPAGGMPECFPLDVQVGGEVMRVTGIAGTSPQTFTVTRAVNGISKPHAPFTAVRVHQPFTFAL